MTQISKPTGKDTTSKEKPVVDPQAVNKKIAERLLKFNKEMFKERDGGGTEKK